MTRRFKIEKELRTTSEKNTGLIGEMVRGLRDVKVLNSEKHFVKKIEKNLKNANDQRYKMRQTDYRWSFWIGNINDLFSCNVFM